MSSVRFYCVAKGSADQETTGAFSNNYIPFSSMASLFFYLNYILCQLLLSFHSHGLLVARVPILTFAVTQNRERKYDIANGHGVSFPYISP